MKVAQLAVVAVLAVTCLVAVLPVEGQTLGAVPRVGVIHHGGEWRSWEDGLRQGLRERGLEEGKHLVLDVRQTKGDLKAVEVAARDLERGKVALICIAATSVTQAAMRATTQTAIVFLAGSDPVAAGLVDSLARPGGRLTGVHNWVGDLTGKRLEILKEIVPGLRRVVIFYDPSNTVANDGARQSREAARKVGVEIVERRVATVEDLRVSLQGIKAREADAYLYSPDAMVTSQSQLIIDAARTRRWPTMFHEVSRVASGALASYGYNYHEAGRMQARYVQRILAGTPPRDLPVENYDRIELALNLRTAREIGLTIPVSVRQRADKIIE